jgi:hypothetical protein
MAYTRQYQEEYYFPYLVTRTFPDYSGVLIDNKVAVKMTGSRSGTKLDNWKEIIRNGGNATTPYISDRTSMLTMEKGSGSAILQDWDPVKQQVYTVTEKYDGFVQAESTNLSHLSVTLPTSEATALTKIYKKIESMQSQLNSPAVLAEGLDVIRQFGAPFSAIIDLTNRRLNRLELERRGLKGSTSFKRIKWAQIVASSYLEYSFGLKPLISDTEDLAKALARWQYEATGESRTRTRAVGRGIDEVTDAYTVQRAHGMGLVFDVTTRTHTEHRVQYIAGLDASAMAAFGSNDRLLQLCGFNPANWIPAAWEVVPWSWLFDYFFNIQDILQSGVTSTAGVKWISKAVTQVTTREIYATLNQGLSRERAMQTYGYVYGYSGSGSPSSLKRIRTTLSRSVPLSLGIVPLTVSYPTDMKKYANMVAVLFSRKPSSSALWLF